MLPILLIFRGVVYRVEFIKELYVVVYLFGYFSRVAVKWWNDRPSCVVVFVYFGKEIEAGRCDVCDVSVVHVSLSFSLF